jgi:hypothetical protein
MGMANIHMICVAQASGNWYKLDDPSQTTILTLYDPEPYIKASKFKRQSIHRFSLNECSIGRFDLRWADWLNRSKL